MGLFKPNEKRIDQKVQQERDKHRDRWPIENELVAALAKEATPLNDRFEEGHTIHPGVVLRYICALERRVARLERKPFD